VQQGQRGPDGRPTVDDELRVSGGRPAQQRARRRRWPARAARALRPDVRRSSSRFIDANNICDRRLGRFDAGPDLKKWWSAGGALFSRYLLDPGPFLIQNEIGNDFKNGDIFF